MSTLIEEFKKEHSEIIDALKECKELGIFTKKGQAKLILVKESLFEHSKEEEERVYPTLWKEAEQNLKLKESLEIFKKDWGNVCSFAFGVFDKYEKEVLCDSLMMDFETLFSVLRNRMRNEEDFLFDEYERIGQ
jgi:hypothetical protein